MLKPYLIHYRKKRGLWHCSTFHFRRFYRTLCDLFHSTTRDEKHWPEHEWRNLIEKLTALSVQVRLPWGNEKEKARAERLAVGLSHVVVLPKLSLNELTTK